MGVYANLFIDQKNYSYQSAMHTLYAGVTHQRGILLLNDDIIIIIDRLYSNQTHNYSQLFHLFPDANISMENNSLYVTDQNNTPRIRIKQLLSNYTFNSTIASTDPYRGWCSWDYEVALPCYYLSYDTKAHDTQYITIIELSGTNNYKYTLNENSNSRINISITRNDSPFADMLITDFLKKNESIKINEGIE